MTTADTAKTDTADIDTADIDDSLALVLRVLREVLGPEPLLAADTELFDVQGFDSIALAALVEGIEAGLDLPLADELITPEVFATPGLIVARLVRPTLRGEHS